MIEMDPAVDRRILVRRGVVLLPVVLASASWTVSVAGVGGAPRAAIPAPSPVSIVATGPVAVPEGAVEPPASVAVPGSPAKARRTGAIRPVADPAPIPAAALAAYQRAAVVIGAADESCHLAWPLVAAIGKVESDHGRTGASSLGVDGVARPAIVGIRLDGRQGTARISDSDAGRYDGDKAFDRAVGPMQFIPTTWSVVGVDADGDGVRNPQDVDDAALATAVYLCSGDGDLATPADQRQAVLRYNQSPRYADLVLSVMRPYAAADRRPLVAAGYDVPTGALSASRPASERRAEARPVQKSVKDVRPAPAARPAPTPKPKPQPRPAPEPATPLQALLTRTQAVVTCTLRGLAELLQPARFEACVEDLTTR